MSVWWRLARPFTLLPPLLGMLSGAAAAFGAGRSLGSGQQQVVWLVLGAVMASLLNAASNVLNQVHDLELDRINKPHRPLPQGEVGTTAALRYAGVLYLAALALAALVRPAGRPELLVIVAFTAVLTWLYSGHPFRLRRSWWLAPLVIAIPRGGLLKVAGWATVASVFDDREPWILGAVFFLFILGCAPTKDFADVEGDRRSGASSLPIRFGPRVAARLMAPFFVVPWILLPVLAGIERGGLPLLALTPAWAWSLGILLGAHGAVTATLMIRHADDLQGPRGQRAWINLYALMMEAQVGIGVAYLA